MGAKDSKRSCLSYEDAVKRMTDVELKRVCEAFKRLTNGGLLLSRNAFTQNVLGDGVPLTIADWLYTACGGTSRGIALRDLICGLVLLTKGTQEEKIKFLWTLYCNDSGTHILRSEFQSALQIEGISPLPDASGKSVTLDRIVASLFGVSQDKVTFDVFKEWIIYNREATVLSKWLLSNTCVSLSSELETPTFYQTLAGVTHLEEQDICELEKCFWALQSSSPTGHLDFSCLKSLVCPPVPLKACRGLFLALDVNRDDHVDFKELCCGISAACRGPLVERMKFCFKIFDMDRDLYLNSEEVQHMTQTLLFIANENRFTYTTQLFMHSMKKQDQLIENVAERQNTEIEIVRKFSTINLECLKDKLDEKGGLTQEDFLMWSVDNHSLVAPLLELLFQVCHVSLGLKPHCRHNEYEIVTGWLEREERRGYHVGQFWYLIASDWWQQWLHFTTAPKSSFDNCNCPNEPRIPIEEGIACDESLISNTTDYTSASNDFNSNSMESMGDLLSRGDSCSIASSSGVSSSSGTGPKRYLGQPGPINNSSLVAEPMCKVPTLTGEGGRLKRDMPLVQRRDFELVPDSLWKALSMWYGGPLPLPRQVIRPPGRTEVELELYPLNLKILRHQAQQNISGASWSSVVGGYGAAALSTAGITSTVTAGTRRFLAHTAAFSRLATIQQVTDFLCHRLALRQDEARLWLLREHSSSLLDDDNATLQDLGILDADQILLEVRNKDLTWPEELGQLVSGGPDMGLSVERRPTICLPPGATGLHNLGNTCFMNAALQAVSNTRPLTLYFQRDGRLSELNANNPDGSRGLVAKRYSELCKELWAGSTRSVAPLKLRYCVTKYAPHLGGGGQHDSQELLAWLLDVLHEDLNRVAKKQYIELKDSGGRPDEIVAEEAWQHHLNRDHSIITDLFYGQLKSKVTCQTCGHESVRFDPFNLLSLPLPMESYTLCEVLVVRLNGESPVKYGMRLNSEAKYIELKEQLHQLCGIKSDRLLLAEVACCQIKSLLLDDVKINPGTATELYAYEIPDSNPIVPTAEIENDAEMELEVSESPLARSPEVSAGSALCMPNILCFKNNRNKEETDESRLSNRSFKKSSTSVHSNTSNSTVSTRNQKCPSFLIAVHRKCVRQETYFLSQQKSKPSLFGMPLLLGFSENSSCQSLYEVVWGQVTRLLSPLPQSDQTNHATDCDDSLGYEFPFTLKAVLQGGQVCAICSWTKFCRGCILPCSDKQVLDWCKGNQNGMFISIDWDPTALHLRYQSNREKLWIEHESVAICRKLHTEPIDLDYCLKAFTSEERLEAKYHCSNCQDKQPATKKLQIWRLPPILIIHLKRFDYVNNKWVKTQKVVNFPFKDFDPTAYLASVPQETILRHRQLQEKKQEEFEKSTESQPERIPEESDQDSETKCGEVFRTNDSGLSPISERCKLLDCDGRVGVSGNHECKVKVNTDNTSKVRARLESTSLLKTPIIDEHLKDYHQHQLLPGQDPFDLKYQLYAVVSHSGLLNGGHYISYACNPNGHWYCYNDSSCREVLTDSDINSNKSTPSLNSKTGCTPLSRRKNMARKLSVGSNTSDDEKKEKNAPLATSDASVTSAETLNSCSSRSGSISSVEKLGLTSETLCNTKSGSSEKLLKDSPYSSRKSLNSYKCPYGDVKVPKIDTSTAYILFYERSGLNYQPYLPKVMPNANNKVPVDESEENEEIRKQCSIQ